MISRRSAAYSSLNRRGSRTLARGGTSARAGWQRYRSGGGASSDWPYAIEPLCRGSQPDQGWGFPRRVPIAFFAAGVGLGVGGPFSASPLIDSLLNIWRPRRSSGNESVVGRPPQ